MLAMHGPNTRDIHSLSRPLVLIAPQVAEDFPDQLVDVIIDESNKRNWRILNFTLTEGSLLGEQTPAGALTNVLPDEPIAEKLKEIGCPIVRLGRLDHSGDSIIPAVLRDYVEAGRMAADYFAERGFRELALVGHEKLMTMPLLEAGLRERADVLGCKLHLHKYTDAEGRSVPDVPDSHRYDLRTEMLGRWLENLPKPVGLLAGMWGTAGKVNIMCHRIGLSVPEDVAVLSLGNVRSFCELSPVPISAIDFSWRDQGRVAIQLLNDMIRGKQVPPRTYVRPSAIITRRSTDILAVDHPLIARAIRFIWDNMARDVSVDEVAKAMKMPRYKLQRLFRKHLHRGVNAELQRVRLKRFQEILLATDWPVDTIAPQLGFSSASYLTMVFRKAFGLTPKQYRMQAGNNDIAADMPVRRGK